MKQTEKWKVEVQEGVYIFVTRITTRGSDRSNTVWKTDCTIPWKWNRLLVSTLEESYDDTWGTLSLPFVEVVKLSSLTIYDEEDE